MEQEGWYNFEKPLSERIAETVENYGIMDGSMDGSMAFISAGSGARKHISSPLSG